MNSNSAKGAMRNSNMDGARNSRGVAMTGGRVRIVGLDHLARLQQVLAAQRLGGRAPGDRLAGDEKRLGKDAPDEVDIVQNRHDGARFRVPAPHQV